MSVIQYESPNGRFPAHIDHCKDSFVYLVSLGCTANFMVKGPNMEEKKYFRFNSGDMLVFNASSEAAILHEVVGIVGDTKDNEIILEQTTTTGNSLEQTHDQILAEDHDSSCPIALANTFPILQRHRYGVQCRVHFELLK